MALVSVEETMAKRKEPARNDVAVKMDRDVVAEAKMVADSLGISLAQYLSDLVRPLVRQHLEREYTRRIKGSKPKKDAGDKEK